MRDPCVAFREALALLDPDQPKAALTGVLYQLVADLEGVPDPTSVFPDVFRFIEQHPDVDLGSPGPLVHFLEAHYPAYVDLLVESALRRPVHTSVWMVNRILNAKLPPRERQRLLNVLSTAVAHPLATDEVRQQAASLLDHQSRA